MVEFILSLKLDNLVWSSDFNGDEVGFPEVDVVGIYTQQREDGEYSFLIDTATWEILDFYKDEE